MCLCGYVWVCMGMYGYVWVCMCMYGYVWVCMGMYGYVWVCMGMYGYVWVCMGINPITSHTAAYYNPVSRALALGGDQLAILRLQEAPGVSTSVIQSHKGGLVGVQYTPYFKYIVTACDKAVSAL